MTWPEFVVDFKTLFVAVDWVGAHCVVPDSFAKGDPFEPVDWQAWGLLNFYRVKPEAKVGQLAPAFFYRRSQIVLPQKAGKAPYSAAHICVEGLGPALFAGWAEGGETWDCRDHGCGCGWVYPYQRGEAMGRPWPTPLIQVTATSEDQTDNIFDALRPMIDEGPLAAISSVRTGEEFIRLPNDGRIDVVTSNATSRLGQRVTFVPQDETSLWTDTNRMHKVAFTQRRGLAGMGGRAEETTNAWDPNVDSQARRTAKNAESMTDIFRLHPRAPAGLKYTVKAERRKIHRYVYRGSPWVDQDAIEGEAAEILKHDPGQAERFFGNNPIAGIGLAFDADRWKALAKPREVLPLEVITVGIDGASHEDALAVIATHVKSGYTWPLIIIERPPDAGDDYKHDLDAAFGAVVDAAERFTIWRIYIDPQYISELVEKLSNRLGERRVIEWMTYRPRPIAWAVRNFEVAVGDGAIEHDGNPILTRHIENSHKAPLTVLDDKERPMHTLCKEHPHSEEKIDGAMGSVLAWEARGDCIADGGVHMGVIEDPPEPPEPESWKPGHAPRVEYLQPLAPVGPMGDMS
jgi:hypothetical protein